jgi:hypothetical protein
MILKNQIGQEISSQNPPCLQRFDRVKNLRCFVYLNRFLGVKVMAGSGGGAMGWIIFIVIIGGVNLLSYLFNWGFWLY